MANGDLWRSVQNSLNWAGHGALAGIAGGNAQAAEARARAAEEERRKQEQFVSGLHSNIKNGQARAAVFGTALPADFKPIATIPAMLGQFPAHPDGFEVRNPWVATQWLSANRPDAMGAWNQTMVLALIGHPASQFTLAHWLDNGEDGLTRDPIRAFLYFYRAGQQGHAEARPRAEKLADELHDFAWIIDPPYLIHPGNWQLIQDKFGQSITTMPFGFAPDNTLSGQITDVAGIAGDQLKAMMHHPIGAFGWQTVLQTRFSGRWSFDRESRFLTMHVVAHLPGADPAGPDMWRIELMGVRLSLEASPVFYGKDKDGFTYHISAIVA